MVSGRIGRHKNGELKLGSLSTKINTVMHELAIAIAKMAPEEMLLETLKEALESGDKDRIKTNVVLLAARYLTEDESVEQTLSGMEKLDSQRKLMRDREM